MRGVCCSCQTVQPTCEISTLGIVVMDWHTNASKKPCEGMGTQPQAEVYDSGLVYDREANRTVDYFDWLRDHPHVSDPTGVSDSVGKVDYSTMLAEAVAVEMAEAPEEPDPDDWRAWAGKSLTSPNRCRYQGVAAY